MAGTIAEASFVELLLGCAVFFGALTAIGLASGFVAERIAWARGKRIYAVALKRGQLRHEAIGTGLSLAVFVPAAAATLASGAIRFTDGWTASVVTFAVCWIAFQVFYYGLHRAMHGSTRLFRFHRWHHVSMVTTPVTGLSMHPVEAIGWSIGLFGPGLLLSQLGLLGLGGWVAFFAVHFIGNIAGHANAEIFGVQSTRTSSILSNPIVYHSLHHARFDRHYGFAAALMDRLFGTEWPDWLPLHRRIMSGRPLESLREKADG